MNRAPPFRVMFERLCQMLGTEESKFVAAKREHHRRCRAPKSYSPGPRYLSEGEKACTCPPSYHAHQTKGLSLGVQHGMPGLRIQVYTHSGDGTGGNSFLYSFSAGDFARKVWAIQDGLRMADTIGTLGKVKP